MIKASKLSIIGLLFLISFTLLSADSEIPSRSFDQDAMQQYAESADFDYMNLTIQPPSIWQRIQWWFLRMFQAIFSNPNAPIYVRLIFYGILFFVLGGAIFYITRLKYGGAVTSDSKGVIQNSSSLEHTKSEDFEAMINGAIQDQNYKLAIRYVYLMCLSQLAKKELIKLKDWKSPYDYENELTEELRSDYKDLSRLFEYVWYGDFEAKENDYLRSNDLIKKMGVRV